MKPPNENGGPVSEAAARVVVIPAKEPDAVGELVNHLRQRARHYFTRYQTTGSQRDIRRATMMQAALVGILEARRPCL